MNRWIIRIQPNQLQQLPREQRDLGTKLEKPNGEIFLVFRDHFVASKVASSLGKNHFSGKSLPAHEKNNYTPLAQFNNGNILVAQP